VKLENQVLTSELNTAADLLDPVFVSSAKDVVERMRRDADKTGAAERRSAERVPFFSAATIELKNGDSHAAFTRDISTPGIGLLHRLPIESGEVTVHIPFPSGMLAQRTLILWCQEVGEGWYASGGHFLDRLAPPSP
jgi:hypothetical protein